MQRLKGEIAVVTGADSGIGQAIAVAFAHEGADLAMTYFHDSEGMRDTVRAVEAAGGNAYSRQLDQRDPAAVAMFFRETRDALDVPTILVNNAGRNFTGVPLQDMEDEQWDAVIRTDLTGPFYCCREFIRMIDGSGKHGSIINVTSVHQEIAHSGGAAYDSAKGGLRNLAATLALELAERNINVNNIAPGMILTPMNQEAVDDKRQREQQEQSIPLRRAGLPDDIAHAAVFLASADARYIHGTTITVDGGLALSPGKGG